MDKAKIEHHIKHLEEVHRGIDKTIKEMESKYESDRTVTSQKKQKLKIKDEIESLKRKLNV